MTTTKLTLSELREALEALAPKEKTEPTARDMVRELDPILREKRDAGHSLQDLAQFLSDRGVTIKASTLGSYMRSAANEEVPPARKRRKKLASGDPEIG